MAFRNSCPSPVEFKGKFLPACDPFFFFFSTGGRGLSGSQVLKRVRKERIKWICLNLMGKLTHIFIKVYNLASPGKRSI